jgi:hypothetical protein
MAGAVGDMEEIRFLIVDMTSVGTSSDPGVKFGGAHDVVPWCGCAGSRRDIADKKISVQSKYGILWSKFSFFLSFFAGGSLHVRG